MLRRSILAAAVAALCVVAARPVMAQTQDAPKIQDTTIPAGSKIFIQPMGGFETYLAAGIIQKKVPLVMVMEEDKADFVISGISSTEKAGWAKMLFMGSDATNDMASIKIVNKKTNEVAFAYAVHKGNSVNGAQSAAEACAKHLKAHIEGKEKK